jgi:hypothetical protein
VDAYDVINLVQAEGLHQILKEMVSLPNFTGQIESMTS